MVKLVLSAVAAATLCVSNAVGQSLVQRSDWQNRKFETYLPRSNATAPWLELDTKTKLPKGDIPLGRDVASVGRLALSPLDADVRVSTNAAFRSM